MSSKRDREEARWLWIILLGFIAWALFLAYAIRHGN